MKHLNDIAEAAGISSAQAATSIPIAADWLRLPKPGGRLEGLSRTTLNELSIPCAVKGFRPPVRSILIKKRGAARGIRLINRQSLYQYLQHLADEQSDETNTAREMSK